MNMNFFNMISVFFFILLTFFVHVPPTPAATFNVTNGTQLQAALSVAENNNQNDIINLAVGNYDASGGPFTYIADNTMGSEENFSLNLIGSGVGQTVLDGGDTNQVMALITDVILTDNSGADIQVSNMTFQRGNSIEFGGGLRITNDQGDATVENCEFLNNHTDNFAGGLDMTSLRGKIILNNSTLIGNSATSEISAVELFSPEGSIVATNNIIFDNQSFDNGGFGALFVVFGKMGGPGGTADIINNTIMNNSAMEPLPSNVSGGGIYVELSDTGNTANLFNNIIFGNSTNNSSGQGGEDIFIFNDGNLGVVNLFNNDFIQICLASLGSQVVDTCDPTGVPNLNFGNNLDVDPQLVDPTAGNFNLAATSPVIDKGDSTAPALPNTDHDGNPRVSNGQVDMGALEFQVQPTPTPTPDAGGCSIGGPTLSSFSLVWIFLLFVVGGVGLSISRSIKSYKETKTMRKLLNHWLGFVAILLGFTIFSFSNPALAGRDLLNELGKKVDRLDADKNFEKKKLLIMVGQNKRTTTVDKFLSTIQTILSESQYHLFTLPLVMSSLQQMPVAKIKVSGTIVADLGIGNTLPAGLEGVADIYLIYEGDSTLPSQVMANLGSAEE